MQKTKEIQQELEQYIDPVKREYLPNFLKPGKDNTEKVTSFSVLSFPTPVWWRSGIRMCHLR